MSSDKQEASAKGDSNIDVSKKGSGGTFSRRIRSWWPGCAKQQVQGKPLTRTLSPDPVAATENKHSQTHPHNAIHSSSIQQYGHYPGMNHPPPPYSFFGLQAGPWGPQTNFVHGQYSHPLSTHFCVGGGETRIFKGKFTTSFEGTEHTMSTTDFLARPAEQRDILTNASCTPHSNNRHPPIPPPPNAPPPPPKLNIRPPAAEPNPESATANAPNPPPESNTKDEKKCWVKDCGKTMGLADIHGVKICTGCLQQNNYVFAMLPLVRDEPAK